MKLLFGLLMLSSVARTSPDDFRDRCIERLWDIRLVSTGDRSTFDPSTIDLADALVNLRLPDRARSGRHTARLARAIRTWLYVLPSRRRMRVSGAEFVDLAVPELVAMVDVALVAATEDLRAKILDTLQRRLRRERSLLVVYRLMGDSALDFELNQAFVGRLARDLGTSCATHLESPHPELRRHLLAIPWEPVNPVSYASQMRERIDRRLRERHRRGGP